MKQLVLIGGGHAHVYVLDALARQPFAHTEVTLISPYRRQIYSGMLPGWIAGHYTLDECALPLDVLAQRANVRLVETACIGLDMKAKQVHCANGNVIPFDMLSIDSGAIIHPIATAEAEAEVLAIRPIEGFVAAWPGLLENIRQAHGDFDFVIIGDGAAGVELAFAIQARMAAERLGKLRLTLVAGNAEPLAGFPTFLRRKVRALLEQRGIRCLAQQRALAVSGRQVRLDYGSSIPAHAVLLVTGAAPPEWLSGAGLAVDERGFLRVSRTLQSISHPAVFAAGDVAAYADARPKSGVFAVRAGPPLAANLRAVCAGAPLTPWQPQRRALYLISTGQQYALAAWGGFSVSGDWVWRWKDRIDRRFIARFSPGVAAVP